MTLRQHQDTPCWEVHSHSTNLPPEWESGDGWAHFKDRAECEAAIDKNDRGYYQPAQSFPQPCVGIWCDGCGDELDASGEGYTHFNPSEPIEEISLDTFDWTDPGDGKHYCWECTP